MADRVAVMDAGRILQIGPPRDLYERPATRRVARFFGDINMWEATVGAQPGHISVPSLGFDVKTLEALPPAGTAVAVVLRPERISMSRQPAPTESHGITGTVEQALYLGTTTTYFVRAPRGAVVRVAVQNAPAAPAFNAGETVYLSWPSAAATVLAE